MKKRVFSNIHFCYTTPRNCRIIRSLSWKEPLKVIYEYRNCTDEQVGFCWLFLGGDWWFGSCFFFFLFSVTILKNESSLTKICNFKKYNAWCLCQSEEPVQGFPTCSDKDLLDTGVVFWGRAREEIKTWCRRRSITYLKMLFTPQVYDLEAKKFFFQK